MIPDCWWQTGCGFADNGSGSCTGQVLNIHCCTRADLQLVYRQQGVHFTQTTALRQETQWTSICSCMQTWISNPTASNQHGHTGLLAYGYVCSGCLFVIARNPHAGSSRRGAWSARPRASTSRIRAPRVHPIPCLTSIGLWGYGRWRTHGNDTVRTSLCSLSVFLRAVRGASEKLIAFNLTVNGISDRRVLPHLQQLQPSD